MNVNDPRTWGGWLLPKTEHVKWTWRRWLLFAFAISMLIDSFFVPFYGNVDPGGSGAGMLFLILGFRASSRRKLPVSVVAAGGCAAALASALNHRLLKSPSWVWTPLGIFLILFVVLWGRGKPDQIEAVPSSARPDTQSALHLGDKGD